MPPKMNIPTSTTKFDKNIQMVIDYLLSVNFIEPNKETITYISSFTIPKN